MSIKKGQLTVDGQTMNRLVLWTDTAPEVVQVVCRPPKAGAVLRAWNNWDRNGTMMAWLGNAGMLVEDQNDCVVLRCSDGIGPPDFEDLVVELRLERGLMRP